MFGGPPIRMQPQYVQPQYVQPPTQTYPVRQPMPAQAPQQWSPPSAQTAPPQQFRQVPTATAQQTPAQGLVRAKPYDDPPPAPKSPSTHSVVYQAPVSIPSAGELGLTPLARPSAPAIVTKVDWNAAHERLRQLGGIGLQSVPLPGGSYRVAVVLGTGNADQVHHIEATAPTEAEAVNAAMERAEQWVTVGR